MSHRQSDTHTHIHTHTREHCYDITLWLYLLFVDYQKGISIEALGRHVQTLHDSAVFVTNRRRPELLDGGDYRAGLKCLLEERLISVKPSAVESRRESSSFCGEFWIHIQFCLLSSRLQMSPSTWGWVSGTGFQYNLPSLFQALHVLDVWTWDSSWIAAHVCRRETLRYWAIIVILTGQCNVLKVNMISNYSEMKIADFSYYGMLLSYWKKWTFLGLMKALSIRSECTHRLNSKERVFVLLSGELITFDVTDGL